MYNKDLLIKIAKYGDVYIEKFLTNKFNKELLQSNWWEALIFFFSHIFFQGRSDAVSDEVLKAALTVLEKYFSKDDRDTVYSDMKSESWKTIQKRLERVIGKGKVGKHRDIEMAIESLDYIDTLENKNVVKHSVNEIINNNLHAHYFELINIRQIGPKISALYLRNIVCFYELSNLINDIDYSFLQPIDTWVNKITHKIGLTTNTKNMEEIRIKIIKACRENNISSLKFNQGAWYIGSNAYEILLENLINIE